ncbi:NYN domain-containing protein [Haloferax namakaokahaiae]|uniref:NYN domain-containing protein n=1 Tax=Haloferax namakaokahaiae TaxID=1748331 RepID=A0ABD5ZBC6_9EURY
MDLLRRLFGPGAAPSDRVALFVDGPNVLRDEFDVDLDDIREAARALGGQMSATRLYLDEHATPGLIQAAEARGFEVVVTSGDVDVRLAIDMTRYAIEGLADAIVIASRDTDFKPALEVANEYGIKTIALAPGSYGRSDALQNAATHAMTLDDVTE